MGKTEDIIIKAVRDITRAGVYRSPKSKVREDAMEALITKAREMGINLDEEV